MNSRIATSIYASDTDSLLRILDKIDSRVQYVEICLDRMGTFNLEKIKTHTAVPIIISCRPEREGGLYSQAESERLQILQYAIELEFDYVDVEWDSIHDIVFGHQSKTKSIVSRHWQKGMPNDLIVEYEKLKNFAHVVKLVGYAKSYLCMLPVFSLLNTATSPVISIAMGERGKLTRVLSPSYPSCFLTYSSLTSTSKTADGQISLKKTLGCMNLHKLTVNTGVNFFCTDKNESNVERIVCESVSDDDSLISIPFDSSDREFVDFLNRFKKLHSLVAINN